MRQGATRTPGDNTPRDARGSHLAERVAAATGGARAPLTASPGRTPRAPSAALPGAAVGPLQRM